MVRSLTDDWCLAVLLPSGREEAKAVLLGLRATLEDAKDNLNLEFCMTRNNNEAGVNQEACPLSA